VAATRVGALYLHIDLVIGADHSFAITGNVAQVDSSESLFERVFDWFLASEASS